MERRAGEKMEYKERTIKELPESERPYEKFEQYGAQALSDAELLAVIIRTGTRKERCVELTSRVLTYSVHCQGLMSLYHMTMKELMQIRGIGRVKAIQLLCIAELSKRLHRASFREGICFNHPKIIAEYYMEQMRHLNREQVMLALLDSKARLIRSLTLSIGTVNSSMLSPREIFLEAVKAEAVSFILLHNHPSGDPSPSREDILITKRVQESGELLGISLLDHIIIGDKRYISLKESGYLL